jgi:sec-independent protein translocase protein TatC
MMNAMFHEPDPDDMFADTRMSFGEHIEVLRRHLLQALGGFVLALLVSFFFAQPVLDRIQAPVQRELESIAKRRLAEAQKLTEANDKQYAEANAAAEIGMDVDLQALADRLGIKVPPAEDRWVTLPVRLRPLDVKVALSKVENLLHPPALVALSVTEGIMIWIKVAVYCGIVLSSPWIFYQLWSFVAAGLYPHEKRLVNVYLPISVGLFLAGVFLAEFLVIPSAIHYLLAFNEWLNLQSELRLGEWLTFAILMPLVFGIAFQTPVVMLFLSKLRIVNVDTFRRHRRIAWFLLALAAILLTASPDAVSYLSLLIPLLGLYELGIVFCWLFPPAALPVDLPESEDLVEV